jgi:translocation and assembly module TamB
VLLPEVQLQPADLTNAALASNDEVIVGAPPVDPATRWIVVSDIRVELGEQVHMDAFGLTGRLGGALNVRTDEFQVTRGLGELGIVEGQYAAFGRRLDITRGRLIFNNEQLGDPGVDLRAQRNFPDVLAGVNVRGTLRTPRMTFFSEPSLPQWQIASLLFAGGTLQSAQNTSAQRAASGVLLAQGGAILAQRYGSEIGIQDVSLETNLDDESSLVLGRYLTPRLYISYGISLAEAINTLRLRYTISDRWTLRIESGTAQSADLDYTIFR